MQAQQDFTESIMKNESVQQSSSPFLSSSHQLTIIKIDDVYKGLNEQEIVRFIHTAYNQSFVIKIFQRKIHHYSKTGELLGELNFPNVNKLAYICFMPNSKTVVAICFSPLEQRREQEIIEWDLQNYETKYVPFLRQLKGIGFSQFFSQSQLYCMVQYEGQYQDSYPVIRKLKLIYLNFPQSNQFSPLYVEKFDIPKEKINLGLKMIKLNNRSMVGLISTKLCEPDQLQILTFDLEHRQKLRKFKFNYELNVYFSICSAKISDIYEFKPGTFYIKIQVEPNHEKLGERLLAEEQVLYGYEKEFDFIWNYEKGDIQQISFGTGKAHFVQFITQNRELKSWVKQKKYIKVARQVRRQKMRSENAYDYKHCMQDRLFDEWERKKMAKKQVSIFYVDAQLKIKAKEKREFPIQSYNRRNPEWIKFCPINYNPRIFIEYYEQKKKQKVFLKVRIVKQFQHRADLIYVGMVTQLIENPDETLLEQVINLLEWELEMIQKFIILKRIYLQLTCIKLSSKIL